MQAIVQGPLTVPTLGLGSQRWRRNEIMLFLISSAKKIFHLLPVRDARFSNKKMAVSLTSSCSCGNRCVMWVSLLFRSFPASAAPRPPPRFPTWLAQLQPRKAGTQILVHSSHSPSVTQEYSPFPSSSYPHYASLNDCGSRV